jgi:tetratricopeptide (TPR) repeat protein
MKRAVCLIFLFLSGWAVLNAVPENNRFEVLHFGLEIEIEPERHRLIGEATIRLRSGMDGLKSFHFHIRPTLRIKSARDEKNIHLAFSQTRVQRIFPNSDTSLVRVGLSRELLKGETTEIFISYEGIFYMSSDYNPKEKRYNRAFSSITKEAAWLRPVQLWYPYIAQKFMPLTIKAKVPSGWTVITNGELKNSTQEKEKRILLFQEDETSSLDITLFAAPYVSKSKKICDFHIMAHFFPCHRDFLDSYLEKTGEILSFYTQKFGRPRAEKFSIIEIGMGYGTGTSAPFGYGISSHLINHDFTLLPHEIAHLWWGETVAFHLGEDSWLHEGLATFSDYYYRLEKASDKDAKRRLLFELLNKAIPVGNPNTLSILEGGAKHAPEAFLIYERAAYMIQTLKHILGEEVFLEVLRRYIETFRDKKADTEGFIRVVNSVSQRDLHWFFDFYLRGKKPPRYEIKLRNLRSQVEGTISQHQVSDHFRMPLTVEFLTNQRSFRREVEVKGKKRKFVYSLEPGEFVSRVVIDPEFEVLGVREVLEDRWRARSLRLEAARKKDFQRVRPLLFSIRDKYPDNVHILHEMAQFYFAQEEWNKGIELYQKILSFEPYNFDFIALANIAGAYETMGDTQMQEFYLEKAVAKGSSMYSILRSLMDKLDRLKESTQRDRLNSSWRCP